ncbi:ABC transporter substrate-binding protein [Pseudomonas sp. HR96]|uniref:ABC transporter substrate-binding protein n=1 Tax=Pseudomonas sp. HR96 TaxID=1027966 RepID=UPI002A755A1A|nr:ABC transporter substrate-binding protein [Pseudomonas sp. HR96]WPO98181.1 ABC transporter substrate-binding protein [Pseudomonas sp. HR96]
MSARAWLSAAALALCSAGALADAGHLVRDDAGQQVSVPASPQHIADAWYAHHALLMTLGAGDRIAATVNHEAGQPWMFLVQPSLRQALSVPGNAFGAESLLAAKVDLAFVSTGDRNAQAYQQAGIAVVHVGFKDIPGLQHTLLLTAQALGSDSARQRAQAYNAYLDKALAEVSTRTASLTAQQRPRVLHIASLNPLKVDGDGTLIDDWIKLVGGRNAADGLHGNLQTVSAEQLLGWQPDVLILAANAGNLADSPASALLGELDAVQHGRVLRNPAGVFPWDRYGTEIALQLPWAAQQLHPELFKDVDLNALTIDFYRRFFDYPLSTAQAARIIGGLLPQ